MTEVDVIILCIRYYTVVFAASPFLIPRSMLFLFSFVLKFMRRSGIGYVSTFFIIIRLMKAVAYTVCGRLELMLIM